MVVVTFFAGDADEDGIYSVTLQNGKGEWDLTIDDHEMAHGEDDHGHEPLP